MHRVHAARYVWVYVTRPASRAQCKLFCRPRLPRPLARHGALLRRVAQYAQGRGGVWARTTQSTRHVDV